MSFEIPNYTQIPNHILDNLLMELSGSELKILLFIFRKTFGFHKTRDRISLSQIKKHTGVARDKINPCVQRLIEMNLIIKESDGENGSMDTYYEISFKEFDTGSKKLPPPSSKKLPTKETHTKEKRTKENRQNAHKCASCVGHISNHEDKPVTKDDDPDEEEIKQILLEQSLQQCGVSPQDIQLFTKKFSYEDMQIVIKCFRLKEKKEPVPNVGGYFNKALNNIMNERKKYE